MSAFVQAKHFHAGGNRPIKRVVIHDMEMPEKPNTAEECAAYFARGAKVASAHWCVDSNSEVECVHEGDIAYHAPPNTGSIGIEHAGYAKQATGDWLDAFGIPMLRDISAPRARRICDENGIPLVWLSVADLLAGKEGITSHNNVSLAFHKSTHTDPGPGFPIDKYMAWVRGDAIVPEGDEEMRQIFYRVSVDDKNSKTAEGDFAIWVTTDTITTHVVSEAAWVHAKNLGWWDESKVIFIPDNIHNWLVSNTSLSLQALNTILASIKEKVVAAGGSLTEADIDAIAEAVLDEEHARLES